MWKTHLQRKSGERYRKAGSYGLFVCREAGRRGVTFPMNYFYLLSEARQIMKCVIDLKA